MRRFYDKMRQLLQNETLIKKCVGTHPSIKSVKNKFRKITKLSRKAIKDIRLDKSSSVTFQLILLNNVICVFKP